MNSDNLQKLQKLNQLTDSMLLEISKISQKDKKKIYHNEYASLIYILYFCIQLYNIKHIQKGGINLVPAWDKETNVDTGKKTWVNRWPEKKNYCKNWR